MKQKTTIKLKTTIVAIIGLAIVTVLLNLYIIFK